jgi:hypothetical protein
MGKKPAPPPPGETVQVTEPARVAPPEADIQAIPAPKPRGKSMLDRLLRR